MEGWSLASHGLFDQKGSLGESSGKGLDLRSFLWFLIEGPRLIFCSPHRTVLRLWNNPPLGLPCPLGGLALVCSPWLTFRSLM